jgi:hypothetical protein
VGILLSANAQQDAETRHCCCCSPADESISISSTESEELHHMAETLRDAFIDELRDAYDAEKQLTKALPKMAKAATSPQLRTAFESHLQETRGQIERLEQAFQSLTRRSKASTATASQESSKKEARSWGKISKTSRWTPA